MVNFAQVITILGVCIGFIGTYILALPELDRFHRRRFYRNVLWLNDIYENRESITQWSLGTGFAVENYDIGYTLIDYLDMPDSSLREEVPVRVESEATRLRFHYTDGGSETAHLGNTTPRRALWEVLSLVLDRRCRRMGVTIALIGALLAVGGATM